MILSRAHKKIHASHRHISPIISNGNNNMNKLKKSLLCLIGIYCTHSYGAGFLLWEQNGAGVGNYHAGAAVDAFDASTGFYNPAGLINIRNQQLVAGAVVVPVDLQYSGTISVRPIDADDPIISGPVNQVQGGTTNVIPDLHYAIPINQRMTFGFNVSVPFGVNTDYGHDTLVRYAGTQTTLETVDIGPSLGYQVTKNFSLGGGLDAVYLHAIFDQYAAGIDSAQDTLSDNEGHSWGYGYHVGALLQATQATRLGLTFHSQIVQHMTGTSTFSGYFANGNGLVGNLTGGVQTSDNLKANITLPAFTTFSALHDLTEKWRLLGSVTYTQWSSIQKLLLQGIAAADTETLLPIDNASVYIYEGFRDAWNFAVGTEYRVSPTVLLRSGMGYDQTPVRNSYRYLQTPDTDRYAVAIGGQYKPNKKFIVDMGWTHLFLPKAYINTSQTIGVNPNNPNPTGQTVTSNGYSTSNADVFGMQLTWNID